MALFLLSRACRGGWNSRRRMWLTGDCPLGIIWTDREMKIVCRFYPNYARIERLLPHRTPATIRRRAVMLGLAKKNFVWTSEGYRQLSALVKAGHSRREIRDITGATLCGIKKAIEDKGLVPPRHPPAPARNPLVHAIRQRAYQLNWSMTDLFEEFGIWFTPSGRIYPPMLRRVLRTLDGKLIEDAKGVRIVWKD